jgi:hypothetical protein
MIDYTLLQNKEWDKIISYWNTFLELEPGHASLILKDRVPITTKKILPDP